MSTKAALNVFFREETMRVTFTNGEIQQELDEGLISKIRSMAQDVFDEAGKRGEEIHEISFVERVEGSLFKTIKVLNSKKNQEELRINTKSNKASPVLQVEFLLYQLFILYKDKYDPEKLGVRIRDIAKRLRTKGSSVPISIRINKAEQGLRIPSPGLEVLLEAARQEESSPLLGKRNRAAEPAEEETPSKQPREVEEASSLLMLATLAAQQAS